MILNTRIEEPRKMIDLRVKLMQTTGRIKKNKSGKCIIKSFQ